jgi:hypothetical protein
MSCQLRLQHVELCKARAEPWRCRLSTAGGGKRLHCCMTELGAVTACGCQHVALLHSHHGALALDVAAVEYAALDPASHAWSASHLQPCQWRGAILTQLERAILESHPYCAVPCLGLRCRGGGHLLGAKCFVVSLSIASSRVKKLSMHGLPIDWP